MKTLYLECNMGAAGDMLTAALLELIEDKAGFLQKLNEVGIPKVKYQAVSAEKCGILGTRMVVTIDGEEEEELHHHNHEHEHEHTHEHEHEHTHEHEHEHMHEHGHDHGEHCHHHEHSHEHHHHTGLGEIEHIVSHLRISEKVRRDILAVYGLIAEAEGHAHGKPVSEIHFHEVGNLDAIADVTAVCLLMEAIAPERVVASPVHVGSGHVHCAHGVLPVPAPATAYLLKDIPIYGGTISGELCTPTGAALLKHFVSEFSGMPVMTLRKTGYGMGKKDFPMANCVRAMLGDTPDTAETVYELRCNLDDMTAEDISFARNLLFQNGALDVFTYTIGMKKGRIGTELACMCRAAEKDKLIDLIFKHSSTLGMREYRYVRHTLNRREELRETAFGTMRVKVSTGHGITREKYEHDDLEKAAQASGLSIEEVRSRLASKQ